jgi:hypothetical protein
MAKVKAPPVLASPAALGAELPGWLQDFGFSDQERAAYRGAADRLGLEVGHWARHILNRAAHCVLAVPRRRTLRAPAAFPGLKHRRGRARCRPRRETWARR